MSQQSTDSLSKTRLEQVHLLSIISHIFIDKVGALRRMVILSYTNYTKLFHCFITEIREGLQTLSLTDIKRSLPHFSLGPVIKMPSLLLEHLTSAEVRKYLPVFSGVLLWDENCFGGVPSGSVLHAQPQQFRVDSSTRIHYSLYSQLLLKSRFKSC